jgi:hypothetical protein
MDVSLERKSSGTTKPADLTSAQNEYDRDKNPKFDDIAVSSSEILGSDPVSDLKKRLSQWGK